MANNGETMETVTEFTFLGSKIKAKGDCSHEIKRCLLLGRKAITNIDSTLKSRDITLPTKVHLVKAMVFPVVMYGCESWTVKKAEYQRIDTFEPWSWKRLENPLDCKEIEPVNPKGNQSWIFTGRTDAEAETPILSENWLIGKDSDARKDWRQEEKGTTEDEMVGWHHRLDGWVWASSGSWWWTGKPGMLQSMGLQGVRHDWVTELKYQKLALVPKDTRMQVLQDSLCLWSIKKTLKKRKVWQPESTVVILLEVSWLWVLFLTAAATDNHKHSTLKQSRFITFSSEDKKSEMGLPGLKSRGQQYWFPLEALVKSSVLVSF